MTIVLQSFTTKIQTKYINHRPINNMDWYTESEDSKLSLWCTDLSQNTFHMLWESVSLTKL